MSGFVVIEDFCVVEGRVTELLRVLLEGCKDEEIVEGTIVE
jgi:hypothetical protein